MKFAAACEEQPAVVATIPRAQLESMAQRLRDIGPKSEVRAVRLKFLEHKVGARTLTNQFLLQSHCMIYESNMVTAKRSSGSP